MRHAVIGIDGGGTQTTALLADVAGKVLARAHAGPTNVHRMSSAELRARFAPLLSALFADQTTPLTVEALWAGLAGAGSIPSSEPLVTLLRELLAQTQANHPSCTLAPALPVHIDHDMVIALVAGAGQRTGVVVIAGTGSSVYGERNGVRVRVGGWGPFFGDEGSGYAIGHQALRSVMQSYDGRLPDTKLTEMLCSHWQCASPPELLYYWRGQTPTIGEVAELSRLVAAAADAGDLIAAEILTTAADELVRAAAQAIARLGLQREPFALVLSGGVLRHVERVRRPLIAGVQTLAPLAQPALLSDEPVMGAVRLARTLVPAKE